MVFKSSHIFSTLVFKKSYDLQLTTMAPKKNLQLPRTILDQIGGSEQGNGQQRSSHGRSESRKDTRKAARAGKKALRTGPPPQKRQRRTQDHEKDSDLYSKKEVFPSTAKVKAPKEVAAEPPISILKCTKKAETQPKKVARPRSISPPPRISTSMKNKLAEDDEEIAALEKKLGLKKKKGLPQSFKDDGLDELLEGLGEDEETSENQDKKKRKSEADQWLEQKRKKARGIEVDSEKDEEDSEDDDGASDMSLDGLEFSDDESDGEAESGDELDVENDFDGFDSETGAAEDGESMPRVRENPYVAPTTGVTAEKYIPPSLRKVNSSDSEALVRLRRQTQGLVNKLTESNLLSILGEIEKLYLQNPRQHVTSTLVDLLLISVCEPASLPDSLIILPAGFISAVYKIVGTDFGAQIIQRITELFDEHYSRASATGQEGPAAATVDTSKETSNLIMLLSELYIFQVVGSNLMFDYIRLFLEKLSELNAELLLKVIRAAGPQLRQDDPSSLKDIVTMLRPAVMRAGGEENLSVRTKFMIETIDDLKNNKMRAGGQASAVTSEHTIRMKKILGTLNSRSIKGSESLRIGLEDIRGSDKKGKWWLVGASWAGNATASDDAPKDQFQRKRKSGAEYAGTSDLFQLAKEHRMNTDIRRGIFVAIMSAEDYEDAYLRLSKLKLKKVQEYEIPKVLIHCAGAENAYNPYYTLISQKVCGDKKLKTSFQYCLWDLFKQMGETDDDDAVNDDESTLDMRHIVNLAKMFGTLIAEGALNLEVLRNLNLGFLQENTKIFLEVLFVTVLIQCQKDSKTKKDEQAIVNIFRKTKESPSLIRGMRQFVKKTVSKSDIAGGKREIATVKWGCKVAIDTLDTIITIDSAKD